ncbi:MAG: COG1615 family transporter, partial [Cyanothece sp. SIO2G6]|nr:COG1615 family transporter [Cyanothece sp. SIO2G6]
MVNRLSPQLRATATHSPQQRGWGSGKWAIALCLVLLLLHGISTALVEGLWFQEVNYLPVFQTQLVMRIGLGFVAFSVSIAWLIGNLVLAQRLAWSSPDVAVARGDKNTESLTYGERLNGSINRGYSNRGYLGNGTVNGGPKSSPNGGPNSGLNGGSNGGTSGNGTARTRTVITNPLYQHYRPDNSTLRGAMRLWLLMLTVIFLGLMLIGLLLYHGHVALSHWYPTLNILTNRDQVPIMFRPETLWQSSWDMLQHYPWIFGGVPALLVAIALYPRTMMSGVAIGMSVGFSILLSEYWRTALLALHPVQFNQVDPIFHRDISFYIFQLPLWELIAFWAVGLCWLTLLSVTLIYLLSGNSLSQGYFPGFPWPQRRHLYAVSSPVMGAIAFSYWIDRYELLYSPTGVTYGASYTNVVAQLPINTGLSILAGIISIYFLVRSTLHPSEDPALAVPAPAIAPSTVLKRQEVPVDLALYNQPS